jgi:hypothetical protein
MKFISRHVIPAILILGSVISMWFLLANLQPIVPASSAFIVCVIIGLYLVIKVSNSSLIIAAKTYALSMTRRKHFVVAALLAVTLVGLLARLFFYYRFSYAPVSDPKTFYDSARTLAAGSGQLGNAYVAFQPYLSAYNNILGAAIRLVSDPWLATILLNTVLDILSSLSVYILLKKMLKPHSQLPVVAFGVWMLNPLNMIFSVLSLPIIVVNFFVILTILISYLLIQQVSSLNTKKALILSLILGLALGLGNCFRPIFIVAIIALTVLCILMFLTTNRSSRFLKISAVCILLSSLIFTGIQVLNVAFVSNQTGLHAAKNPSGWSMYVGSNMETSGEWRPYVNAEMSNICKDSLAQNNFDKCHAELRSVAIDRYKSYGILKSTSLFIRKLYHQAGQQNYFYNAEQSMAGYSASTTFKFINNYMIIFMIGLFLLSARLLYILAKQATSNKVINPILVFTALVMVGWFFSFMLVESAPRYSTILYPVFIIFAVLGLGSEYWRKSNAK